MTHFKGQALSWELRDGIIELSLHRAPCNEIGTIALDELEKFACALRDLCHQTNVVIISSDLKCGFSAGADLRELYQGVQKLNREDAKAGVHRFLERIHRVLNALDAAPFTTIAAVHGVVFGGGFELALVCDMIIADKTARFCFPELRLGLVPGFGGIPRLNRDLGNAVVRDLLLTGRSFNAAKAQQIGLVSQLVGEGEALRVARSTAEQIGKFDRHTVATAKKFMKPVPYEDLHREINLFCELFTQPAVEAGLKKFVEHTGAQPYLP